MRGDLRVKPPRRRLVLSYAIGALWDATGRILSGYTRLAAVGVGRSKGGPRGPGAWAFKNKPSEGEAAQSGLPLPGQSSELNLECLSGQSNYRGCVLTPDAAHALTTGNACVTELHFHSLLQRVALRDSHLKHVIKRRAADDEDLRFQYHLLTR